MYEQFSFRPYLGLSGSGKSDLMERLEKAGKQVLSIENLLEVRGVCLKNIFDTVPIGQDTFDALLVAEFTTFNPLEPIFIEWKPIDIVGIKLPKALVNAVRSASCIVSPCSKSERILRLVNQYAEWKDHMDVIADGMSSRLPQSDIEMLKNIGKSGDEYRFVETLLTRYFDPLYFLEMIEFKGGVNIGDYDVEKNYFLGTYIPTPSLHTLLYSLDADGETARVVVDRVKTTAAMCRQ